MELRELIEAGIVEKKTVTELAAYLGVNPNSVSNAKAHQRGLPVDACLKLATLLELPDRTVIAASELATERKEDKRAFWLPFVTNTTEMARHAVYVLILSAFATMATPAPSEAAPIQGFSPSDFVLCKVMTRNPSS